jgi:hypothetical protein
LATPAITTHEIVVVSEELERLQAQRDELKKKCRRGILPIRLGRRSSHRQRDFAAARRYGEMYFGTGDAPRRPDVTRGRFAPGTLAGRRSVLGGVAA